MNRRAKILSALWFASAAACNDASATNGAADAGQDVTAAPVTASTDAGVASDVSRADSGAGDASIASDAPDVPDAFDAGSVKTGLAGYCEHVAVCGVASSSEASCVADLTAAYGSCAKGKKALEAFGDCARLLPCSTFGTSGDWVPSETACAGAWDTMNAVECP